MGRIFRNRTLQSVFWPREGHARSYMVRNHLPLTVVEKRRIMAPERIFVWLLCAILLIVFLLLALQLAD
jgi:hypothetical protein